MGCHTGNFLFRCLELGKLWEPGGSSNAKRIRIEGEATGVHAEGYPSSTRVHFHIPARGDLPAVKLTVSSGKEMRPGSELLHGKQAGSFGSLLVGTKGSIYSSNPGTRVRKFFPRTRGLSRSRPGPCPAALATTVSGSRPARARGRPSRALRIGGPLTELIQLANVAGIVGEPFHYDPLTGEIPDHPGASGLLHRPYRKGWTL